MLHWNHVINPELTKGKGSWKPEEDQRILEASTRARLYTVGVILLHCGWGIRPVCDVEGIVKVSEKMRDVLLSAACSLRGYCSGVLWHGVWHGAALQLSAYNPHGQRSGATFRGGR